MTDSISDQDLSTPIVPYERVLLVFGATGQQGGAVVSASLQAGWKVRALVRDPDSTRSKALAAAGVELRLGDLSAPLSIRNAMTGAYGVFSVQPSSGQGAVYGMSDDEEIQYGCLIADIAVELGIQHLVYTSVNAAGKGHTGMGHFDSKTKIEAHIRQLPLQSTIVRPAAFMELMLLPGMGLDKGVYNFFLHPQQAGQAIAVHDIGSIVSKIFADPSRFVGRTIEIAGDRLTGQTIQESLSRAAGKPIAYQRFPAALLEQNSFLASLAALFDDGRLAGNADISTLREEFGPLKSFDEWLQGPGKSLLKNALSAVNAPIALK
jgi:uncharacterized protein YbjT (DUF2867 family)